MVKKAELEKIKEMNKAIKQIDNKWEALAFLWAYRRKELLLLINFIQLGFNVYLIAAYTKWFPIIGKWIASFFGGE